MIPRTSDLEQEVLPEATLYQMLIKRNLRDAFHDVEVLLCLYLTSLTSNCGGERSFYKLKLIKDDYRFTVSQNVLVHLALLSTEWEIRRRVNLDKVLADFDAAETR